MLLRTKYGQIQTLSLRMTSDKIKARRSEKPSSPPGFANHFQYQNQFSNELACPKHKRANRGEKTVLSAQMEAGF